MHNTSTLTPKLRNRAGTLSMVRVAWRELWPAGLATVLLGLVFMALSWALSLLSDDRSGGQGSVGLAMMLTTVWGGVAIASGTPQEHAFLLARPTGRIQRLAVPLAVLLVTVLAAGLLVSLLSGILTQDPLHPLSRRLADSLVNNVGWRLDSRFNTARVPVLWFNLLELLIGLLSAATCGLLAGSLLPDRAPGYGLGFTLTLMAGLLPMMTADAAREAWIDAHPHLVGGRTLLNSLEPPIPYAAFSLLLLTATTLVLAIPVWHYARRWAPLRTNRASLVLTALMVSGMAVICAVVWLIAPALLITYRVS